MSQNNSPPFSIQEAFQRGAEVWELFYDFWGAGLDADGTLKTQWPAKGEIGVPITVAGVAIGAQSHIDRVWLSYNLQKTQALSTEPSVAGLTNRLRSVSKDCPLLFTAPATENTQQYTVAGDVDDPIYTMINRGSMFVWAWTPFVDNGKSAHENQEILYTMDDTATTQTYVDVNGVAQSMNRSTIIPPRLHLVFYLKAPIIAPPTKRSPLHASGTAAPNAGAERLIANIPIFGRKNVHVMMKCTEQSDFRVGVLRGSSTLIGGGAANVLEEPLDIATAIAANTPTVLGDCNQDGVYADWLNLYATPSANAELFFKVTAVD